MYVRTVFIYRIHVPTDIVKHAMYVRTMEQRVVILHLMSIRVIDSSWNGFYLHTFFYNNVIELLLFDVLVTILLAFLNCFRVVLPHHHDKQLNFSKEIE